MVTRRQQRFIHGQVLWMLSILLVLVAVDGFSLGIFFLTSFVGFLALVELTAPINVTPQWRARLKWIIIFGLATFVYVVVRRVLEILPTGVIP